MLVPSTLRLKTAGGRQYSNRYLKNQDTASSVHGDVQLASLHLHLSKVAASTTIMTSKITDNQNSDTPTKQDSFKIA